MEKVTMTKNSPKYGFKKGDEFVVKRNIRNECVIIMDDEDIPNLILSERKLRSYGTLTGTPQKWVLIEVENQNINEPDTYNSYAEAYKEMKKRYGILVKDGEEASIGSHNASIQTDLYNIDWKIYEVN